MRSLHRGLLWVALASWTLVLGACASGTARPKPAELPSAVDLIGVDEVWRQTLSTVDFPLQVRTLDNEIVVATGSGQIVALDAASGRPLRHAQASERINAGVGSDGRIDAVVTRSNVLEVFRGGRPSWHRQLPTQSFTAPLVAGGRVFVLGADRSLAAFDAGNGARLWQLERESEPLVLQYGGILLAQGNTLVAGLAGRLVGVDPDSGTVLWEAPIASARGSNDVEKLVDLMGGVDQSRDRICARAFQAAVGCVDPADGTVLWTRRANGASGIDGDGQWVYGAEADGRILAWRASDGSRGWSTERLKWRRLTGVLTLGRSVVVGDEEGNVHMLSREDGRTLNRLHTDRSGVAATPAVAGNTLVVITHAGNVYGFRPGEAD